MNYSDMPRCTVLTPDFIKALPVVNRTKNVLLKMLRGEGRIPFRTNTLGALIGLARKDVLLGEPGFGRRGLIELRECLGAEDSLYPMATMTQRFRDFYESGAGNEDLVAIIHDFIGDDFFTLVEGYRTRMLNVTPKGGDS